MPSTCITRPLDDQLCASSSVAFPRSFHSPNSGSVGKHILGMKMGTGPSSEDSRPLGTSDDLLEGQAAIGIADCVNRQTWARSDSPRILTMLVHCRGIRRRAFENFTELNHESKKIRPSKGCETRRSFFVSVRRIPTNAVHDNEAFMFRKRLLVACLASCPRREFLHILVGRRPPSATPLKYPANIPSDSRPVRYD